MRDPDSVLRKSSNYVSRKVGSEAVLVPIRANVGDLDSVYTLNPIAERIWSMIDGRTTVAGIVDAICTEYDVDRAEAAADVEALLETFEQANLID